ncbi:MAG TPA: MFS transporter [Solirubrobacteraceae bacterium]|jgi:MFS family permease
MSKTAGAVAGTLAGMRALVILLVGQAMASMDASILVVASPSLQADLHASGGQVQLVVSMYTLAFAAFVVTGARLGDVLGRRRAFLIGLAAFSLASLAGGLAPSPPALIVARALQGTAGALMTPQVLSIIQVEYAGETRARAIGAYSLILAVGVAAGQVLGGLLVGAHLLAAAWRPALLLNAPIGAVLLACARGGLPAGVTGVRRRLDPAGAALMSVALLALVLPLTLGRDAGWPGWIWPSLAVAAAALCGFVAVERRVRRDPVLDLAVLRLPGVAAGMVAVTLIMGCYGGFVLSLTLYLQDGLGFTPLHSGLTFALYAAGFAVASLAWTHAGAALRARLPMLGPLAMGGAVAAIGVLAARGGWPLGAIAPLLIAAGAGHACGFSPLTNRMAGLVRPDQAADLSGLIMTGSLVGQVLGIAAFAGVYLGAAAQGAAHALADTTGLLAAALALTAACGARASSPRGVLSVARTR